MDDENINYIALKTEFEDFSDTSVSRIYHFSNPGKMKIQRCQKEMIKSPDNAFRTLVLDCIKPEEKEEFIKDIDKYPGLPTTFGNEILRRTGFDSLGK